MELSQLEKILELRFRCKELFQQAFTHASYAYEQQRSGSIPDNERIEFLGDAVLQLTVSEYLYSKYPQMSEGEMSRIRARVVCEASLAAFAQKLHFGKYVLLGKGEEMSGGRTRSALLADVFEAFVGALYIDQGLEQVQTFLAKFVFPQMTPDWLAQVTDTKGQLQEWIQQEQMGEITYHIVDTQGPDHNRFFIAEVRLDQSLLGRGEGRTKKEAEQRAALQALQKWK